MKINIPSKSDSILLLIAGILLLAISGYMLFSEGDTDWKYYQGEFRAIIAEQFGDEAAASIPRGIQQVWNEDIDLIDRCTTCHLGMKWQGLEFQENPY